MPLMRDAVDRVDRGAHSSAPHEGREEVKKQKQSEPTQEHRVDFPWEPAEPTVKLHGRVLVKGGEGYAEIEINMSSEEALILADKVHRPERLDIVTRRMRVKMETMR